MYTSYQKTTAELTDNERDRTWSNDWRRESLVRMLQISKANFLVTVLPKVTAGNRRHYQEVNQCH